ncbi:MAG: hypothetical protein Q9195_004682 [Heterodermia aff. obscurata]
MSSIHPVRTSPLGYHIRKTGVKAARSAPVSKTALKGSKVKPVKSEEELVDSFDDDDMDAQIHDNDPLLSLRSSLPTSPIYDGDEASGISTRTILPSKLPTPRPLPTRIPSVAHDGKADLDPTEWKPAEGGSVGGKPGGESKASIWRPKLPHRSSSEAHSYLSQYHRSAPASTRRPGIPTRSTPSLSHTPTTTGSSNNSMAGTPTEVAHDPLLSGTGKAFPQTDVVKGVVKGVELVTPKISSTTSTTQLRNGTEDIVDNTLANKISYDKKWVLNGKASTAGNLKMLLGCDEFDGTTGAM